MFMHQDPLQSPADPRPLWLEDLYHRYHHRRFVAPDPLQMIYGYKQVRDREIAALVAALLAYGNVKAILRGVEAALNRLRPRPRVYLERTPDRRIRSDFRDYRYRVTAGQEMAGLVIGLKRMVQEHEDLEAAFVSGCYKPGRTTLDPLTSWTTRIRRASGRKLNHLLPDPVRGSACKRLHLFLRWMVRCDRIDPGGWHRVNPADLIVPLDTHMHRMARALGFTRRNTPDARTSREITECFRRIQPEDPLRYDFSLTRPGIRRESMPDIQPYAAEHR